MALQIVILAAGKGTRMHSALPKVLHPLAGKPLLEHVIATALHLAPQSSPIIIYGHQGERLRTALEHYAVRWIEQKEQQGTGHAVLQALPHIADQDEVLILYGDVPLISENTLRQLQTSKPQKALGLLTAIVADPAGYGRIKRNAVNEVIGIIEEKDASAEERKLNEINPGIYLLPAPLLKKWISQLKNNNTQKEYYLTDMITFACAEKIPVFTQQVTDVEEILGVNDRIQLAQLERFYQQRAAQSLQRQGVTLYDPSRLDIRGEVTVGQDVIIDIDVILEGRVIIGHGSTIGPFCHLRNVVLGDRVEIKSHTVLDGAEIGSDSVVGPYARIRPGTVLANHAHIGNFVELKNSEVGEGSKINHLSYVGDSIVGKKVNIGAGTITCNYDGVNKHQTVIGDGAFIGSSTQLVAPITVGEGATIGAGSTLTKDAPPHQLTLARAQQQTIKNWRRPEKAEKKASSKE